MNAIAIIIRLLSLFALSGLALVLFLKYEEYRAQDEAFLTERKTEEAIFPRGV